jgi:uncharacterized protein (PEP-CTERM system associated)
LRIRRAAAATLWAAALGSQGADAQYSNPFPATTTGPQPIGSRPSVDLTPGPPARQGLRFEPWIGLEETLTSNADYDRSTQQHRADLVTQITPGFRLAANGAHSSVNGTVAVPVYLYARTGSDNNRVLPDVHLVGNADAFDRRLFVDAGADVHREFLTPFGATPISATTNSLNEYTSQGYYVTPAFRGEFPGPLRYEVKDANLWTRATNAPVGLENAYTNDLHAGVSRDPGPLGWGLDYTLTRVRFTDNFPQKTEITRLHGDYLVDPQLQLSAIIGYENDDYVTARYSNAIYGAGIRWRPTERTSLDAVWEHRFFGTGYNVSFEHRTPQSVWSVRATRDISSYPQQLFALGAGTQVGGALNFLLASRFPDPGQRQQVVDQVVRNYALPDVLPGAVNLYTQNVTLTTSTQALVGLLGARNNVYLTVFRQRNEAVTPLGSDIAEALQINNTVQTGGNAVWSSRLAPAVTLTTQLAYTHATGDVAGIQNRVNNGSAVTTVTTQLSALTDFHVGARYQFVRSNLQSDAEEAAIFVGILHRFY